MGLKDTLQLIQKVSEKYLIDKPYLVGGLPRDLYLGLKDVKTTDLDLTTNSPDILRLGILIADQLNVVFELADDGHLTVFADQFDLDFSSHFVSPKVVDFLNGKHSGLEEAFSRDFTINTLHQDLITEEILDPTGLGFQDIKTKLIKTPVPAEITLTDDPRRAYRAINLAVRYGFRIDEEITDFVLKNQDLFGPEKIKDKYITVKINKSLAINADLTIQLLKKMNLFNKVPLSGDFKNILISKKLLVDYLGPNTKQAQLAHDWSEYEKQGSSYALLSRWWQQNASRMPGDYNSSFSSWENWYMNHYRTDWENHHQGPDETLAIMERELSSGEVLTPDDFLSFAPKKPFDFLHRKHPVQPTSDLLEINDGKVLVKPGVNVDNVSPAVKAFIQVLGQEAEKLQAGTPIITSGWRSIQEQAEIMGKNWQDNGGARSGRKYLTNLYGEDYGSKVANVFERHGIGTEGQSLAVQVIQNQPVGSSHILNPGQAVDLSLTAGIKKVLDSIQDQKIFQMKIVNETGSAGPHYHVSIRGQNKIASKIQDRKERLLQLTKTGNY